MAHTLTTPLLRVGGLKVLYGSREVIGGFDVEVEQGECKAIVGYSGCGKTTVLKALTALLPAAGGNAWLAGEDFLRNGKVTVKRWSLRRQLTLVTQQPGLLPHKTIMANLVLAQSLVLGTPEPQARIEAVSVAEPIGIADYLNMYPNELSGGQVQRAHLARALVLRPRMLLLDEVTSNVDPRTSEAMVDSLNRIRRERAVGLLLVSHDFAVVRELANKVIFLHNGRNSEEIMVSAFPGGFREPDARKFATERAQREHNV